MAELRRLFVPPEAFLGNEIELEGERLRRVRTVLRLRPGDEFAVTDGGGAEFRVALGRIGRTAGTAVVLERTAPQRESPLRTVLAQAVPRGDRRSRGPAAQVVFAPRSQAVILPTARPAS